MGLKHRMGDASLHPQASLFSFQNSMLEFRVLSTKISLGECGYIYILNSIINAINSLSILTELGKVKHLVEQNLLFLGREGVAEGNEMGHWGWFWTMVL